MMDMKNKNILLYSFLLTIQMFVPSSCSERSHERPNVLIILADDMGYSDLSCMGSEIPTPNIDRIAEEGALFTNFYNAARCCPTRASLLTGLYPHEAGMGDMTEGRIMKDGTFVNAYQGFLDEHSITIAELLGGAGYQTFISGKWHVGDSLEHWPLQRGFDRSFALISGASNYFNTEPYIDEKQEIILTLDNERITPGDDYYITDAIGSHAMEFLKERDSKRPFFLYLPFTAPHWPVQAPEEELAKHRGNYMGGWEKLRANRYANMREIGILTGRHTLSPPYFERPFLTPDWDTLSAGMKADFDMRMAAYAATITRMDLKVGEILDYLEKNDELDNTLVVFLSDNGATHAYIYLVTQWIADRSGPIGSERSFDAQGAMWANASNTPYRLFKSRTAEGGIITPLLIRYPEGVHPGTRIRTPGHIIDIMPTIIEATGVHYPKEGENSTLKKLRGMSLLPFTDSNQMIPERPLFWEHQGREAVRFGKWKLVHQQGELWQLYDLYNDPTELSDVSERNTEVVRHLEDMYYTWSAEVGVMPWDSLKLAH